MDLLPPMNTLHNPLEHDQSEISEEDRNPFCSTMSHMGGGMTMYMDGFHFSLSQNPDAPCINLFLPQWTLHSRVRFLIAMAGVVCLGIAVETVATLRARYVAKVKLAEGGRGESSVRVQLVMTLFHGLQACMGYILMLATMTYSIEILICTVIGLSVGFFIRLRYKTLPSSSNATNPCCDFLEDESALNESMGYERIKGGEEGEEVKPASNIFGSSAGLEKRRNTGLVSPT